MIRSMLALKDLYVNWLLEPTIHQFGDYAPFVLFVGGTQALHMTTFWVQVGLLLLVDFYPRRFSMFSKWKIQPNKNNPLCWQKFLQCLKVILFNQIVVNMVVACFVYWLMILSGSVVVGADEFPSMTTLVYHLVIFVLVEEIGFYYSHRLMHHPTLYQMFHKQHHEWVAPIGMAAIYAHPLEHVLCNLGPVVAGPFLAQAHICTYWLWLTVAVATTVNSHCGYHFPFAPSPENHDFHHLAFNVNYGVLGVLDWLHGTDEPYRGSEQCARNYVFMNPNTDILKMKRR
jgi:fatty acid hydroxylase domain-containing protein 2